MNINIVTQRCVIRPFTEADIDRFMAYRNDDGWMRFQGFKGLTRQQYREALLGGATERDGLQLAIAHRQTDLLLGDLYLKQEEAAYDIGYTVAPQFAHQGYAREAVGAAVSWIAANRCPVIRAAVMPGNLASIGLLQALGFAPIGLDAQGDLLYEYKP